MGEEMYLCLSMLRLTQGASYPDKKHLWGIGAVHTFMVTMVAIM